MQLTRQHFVLLADELAEDKLNYNPLAYHEKLKRMLNFCKEINPRFKNKTFLTRISKTYEKLKTLNYNISTAFQRTDQLLRQIEQNYRELFEDEETKTE